MTALIPGWCLAAATIIGEAAAEPYAGQIAVARVIRNRMRLKYQSDGTVAGTVLRPFQFSMWNTGERGRIRVCDLDLESEEAARAIHAWYGSRLAVPEWDAAVLYHTVDVVPSWSKAPQVHVLATLGRHVFYRDDDAAP